MKKCFNIEAKTLLSISLIIFAVSVPLLTDYVLESNYMQWDMLSLITEIPRCMGLSLSVSYKFIILFINSAVAFISYFCFKICFKQNAIALVGCFLYTWCPSRLNGIYIKGNLFEMFMWCVLPVLFAGIYIIVDENSNYRSSVKTICVWDVPVEIWIYGFGVAASVLLGKVLGAITNVDVYYGSEGVYLSQYFTTFFWGTDTNPSLDAGVNRVQAAAPGIAVILLILLLVWLLYTDISQKSLGKKLLLLSLLFMLLSSNIYPINRFFAQNILWTSDDLNIFACVALIFTACYTLEVVANLVGRKCYYYIVLFTCAISAATMQFMVGNILGSRRFLREIELSGMTKVCYPKVIFFLSSWKVILTMVVCGYIIVRVIRRQKNVKN